MLIMNAWSSRGARAGVREREVLDDAVRKTGLPVAGEPVPACTGAGAFGYSSSKAKK